MRKTYLACVLAAVAVSPAAAQWGGNLTGIPEAFASCAVNQASQIDDGIADPLGIARIALETCGWQQYLAVMEGPYGRPNYAVRGAATAQMTNILAGIIMKKRNQRYRGY